MARTTKGLSAVTSRGLNRKKVAKRGRGTGDRVVMKDDTGPIPVQFYVGPSGFTEYEIHRFQEDGNWQIVPCIGDGCPKCDDESDQVSRTSYRFAAPVWHFGEKKSMVLEGPKDMAEKILYRLDRCKGKNANEKEASFCKSTYEAVRFPTNPVTYGMDKGEEEPIKLKATEAKDCDKYVDDQLKSYYGKELPTASSLDDDDKSKIEDDAATTWTKKDLKGKSIENLAKIAKSEGVDKKEIKAAVADDDSKALIAAILAIA